MGGRASRTLSGRTEHGGTPGGCTEINDQLAKLNTSAIFTSVYSKYGYVVTLNLQCCIFPLTSCLAWAPTHSVKYVLPPERREKLWVALSCECHCKPFTRNMYPKWGQGDFSVHGPYFKAGIRPRLRKEREILWVFRDNGATFQRTSVGTPRGGAARETTQGLTLRVQARARV